MSPPQTGRSAPRALLPRSFREEYPLAERAQGPYIWDDTGKQYLDFSGGAAVSFIGHGDPHVITAVACQLARLEFVHSSQFTNPAAEQFAEDVLEFAGPHFSGGAVYFCSGGSEAVETAVKLARQYQVETGNAGRFRVLSRKQSYHGATTGALALSGNPGRRKLYAPLLSSALVASEANTPYCYRCAHGCTDCGQKYAHEVANAIDVFGDVSAFIGEPVSGATLGASVPPADYWPLVQAICRKRGVLLVADEVMTGFGRTGRNFASHHWDVAPDMIIAGKGIASGYAPLAAVIVNRRIADAISGGSGSVVHGLTYSAHPVSCAAGSVVLKRIRDAGMVQAAQELGESLGPRLRDLLDLEVIGDVRGLGLLWAIELVQDRRSKAPFPPERKVAHRIAAACRAKGLMVYPMQGCVDGVLGDHLLLAPPAIISEGQISDAATWLRECLKGVEIN